MRRIYLFIIMLFLCFGTFSQEITVRFTGLFNGTEYRLDSVVVTNLTRDWTETVEYPDTIIVLGSTVGTNLNIAVEQGLRQNVPNPFDCTTRAELSLSQREDVRLQLLDVAGKVCAEYSGLLDEGLHVFDISAANPQTYILNAIVGTRHYSIRMVNVGSGCGSGIRYAGISGCITAKLTTAHEFQNGDNMRYVGYAAVGGNVIVSNVVEQPQTENEDITLEFRYYSNHLNGHECVDLGLPSGSLWATCNVGANSPEDSGQFFAWGETQRKTTYTWNNYIYSNGNYNELTKYCSDSQYGSDGFTDTLTTLEEGDDAAIANWGADWRMPTYEELDELQSSCTVTIARENGIYGHWCTAPNGNSIFLPNAGVCYDGNHIGYGQQTGLGSYWSNSLDTVNPYRALGLNFHVGNSSINGNSRYYGFPVRAVYVSASASVGVPTITVSAANNISFTSATLYGNVLFDGGAPVTERGFVYGTSADNLTENLQCGSGIGSFSGNIIDLTEGTTYYYRAYATNSEGDVYGELMSFTTISSAGIIMINGIAVIPVDCGRTYNFYDSGGPDGNYANNENMIARFSSQGRITLSFTNFVTENSIADYMYVYDGDADSGTILINKAGGSSIPPTVTAYSGTMTVVWHTDISIVKAGWEATVSADCEPAVPVVATCAAGYVIDNRATLYGNVVCDCGSNVTGCGFIWGTSEDDLSQNVTAVLNGSEFSCEYTEFTTGTTYYYQAYAINGEGTGYGEIKSFVVTENIIMDDGVSLDFECGRTRNFYDSGDADGDYDNNEDMIAHFSSSGRITLSFTSFISESCCDYMYVYDGDADSGIILINRAGGTSLPSSVTAYSGMMTVVWHTDESETRAGWEATISADCEPSIPVVATADVSDITSTGAKLYGNVLHDCGSSVTGYGFYYGTSEDDLSQNVAAVQTDSGFSCEITGLVNATTYYYKAYAINSVGVGYGEILSFSTLMYSPPTGFVDGYGYVDLGLPSGMLWATCNIGAAYPEDYGDYFAWGETTTKETYDWSTYIWCNGSDSTLTKYCDNPSYGYNGFTDSLSVLQASDDAATANLGANWRMPTYEELNELRNNCTSTVIIQNGVKGRLFTGPNGNSIFLPAAGDTEYDFAVGYSGRYWSSSVRSGNSYYGRYMGISPDTQNMYVNYRCIGQSIRAVCQSGTK